MSEPSTTRYAVGCMTGTSLDGLDAALVEVTGRGLAMTARFIGMVSRPLGELAGVLRAMAGGAAHRPIDYLRAARRLGVLHAEAVGALLEDHPDPERGVAFVAAHGQTIWHAPGEGVSWQLFDPWPVVRRLGVPVVYDLRQADLIAGGEGAPVTPLADWVLYGRDGGRRGTAIVNLGGICNVTWLADEPAAIRAADCAPCNILLDGVVQRLYPGTRYDMDGSIARRGRVVEPLASSLFANILLSMAGSRSLGREQFTEAMLDDWAAGPRERHAPEDVVASFVAAVAGMIGREVADADRVILAGGGARHPVLVERLRERLPGEVLLSDEVGIPVEAREAAGFAVLGALCQDRVPITLPQVTGAEAAGVAGTWVNF